MNIKSCLIVYDTESRVCVCVIREAADSRGHCTAQASLTSDAAVMARWAEMFYSRRETFPQAVATPGANLVPQGSHLEFLYDWLFSLWLTYSKGGKASVSECVT